MKRQGINRKSALVFLLLFVATCAVILYFKAASDKAAQGSAASPSIKNVGPMARPDTTVTSDVPPMKPARKTATGMAITTAWPENL